MRLPLIGRVSLLVATAAGVAVAGCGHAASAPQRLDLSVLVPVDGTTVVEPNITVSGTVTPDSAVVRVNGRRAPLVQGGFREPVRLHTGINRLRLAASARGYGRIVRNIRVRYKSAPHSVDSSHNDQSQASIPQGARAEAFIRRANRACASADAAVTALPRITSRAILMEDVRNELAIVAKLIDELKAITPPPSLAGPYDTFLASLQRELRQVQKIWEEVQTGRIAEAQQAVSDLISAGTVNDDLASAIGLTDCASTAVPSG